MVLTSGVAWLVGRECPRGANPLAQPLENPQRPWSYPDEPTLLGTALYMALGCLAVDAFPSRRRWIKSDIAAVIILIGLGRMFMGSCYPTDVLGGWLGGASWVLLCRWAFNHWSSAERASSGGVNVVNDPVANRP
jgi:undecaprenyl-diphosphatase